MIPLLQALKSGTLLKFYQEDDHNVVALIYFLEHWGFVTLTIEDGLLTVEMPPEKREAFSPQRVLALFQKENVHANTVVLKTPSRFSSEVFEDVPQPSLAAIPGAFYGAAFGLPKGLTFTCRGRDVAVTEKGRRGDTTHYLAVGPEEFIIWLEHKGSAVAAMYGVPTISSMLRGP